MGKIINTERLKIRSWEENDVLAMVEGLNNESVSKGFGTPYPYTEQMAIDYIIKVKTNRTNNEYFAIELKDAKIVIGGCGIHYKDNIVSISLWLNINNQCKGFGTEALIGLAKYGFEELNISHYTNFYFKDNLPSYKIQVKIGSQKCNDFHSDSKFKMILHREQFYKAILKKSINKQ